MPFVFVDRESTYPNRYLVMREDGSSYYVIMQRADEPVVAGTPLNAETFATMMADAVKTVNGIAPDENGNVNLEVSKKVVSVAAYSDGTLLADFGDNVSTSGAVTFDDSGSPVGYTDDLGNTVAFASGWPTTVTDSDGSKVTVSGG